MTVEKVELHDEGFIELLSSPEVESFLMELANSRISGTKYNYEATAVHGQKRVHVKVRCADRRTYYHTLKTNDLITKFK